MKNRKALKKWTTLAIAVVSGIAIIISFNAPRQTKAPVEDAAAPESYTPVQNAAAPEAFTAADAPYLTPEGIWKPGYRREANTSLTVESLPPRKFKVVDMHEHVEGPAEAVQLLEAMDRLGIQRAALLGASRYTYTLNPKWGFEGYLENNEQILTLAKEYPDRFLAFPTLFPLDEGNAARVEDYANRGAAGLKLYLGHGARTGKEPFHLMPLDDPRMKEIYAWCEKNQFPIIFHINLLLYYDEFIRVMEEFPNLRVSLPHFGLFKNDAVRLERLGWLLGRYPGLYMDVSFGWYEFHVQGFEKMAAWPSRFRDFFSRHADKIMFGSDMVLEPSKDEAYIMNTLRSYLQVLEMEEFRFFYNPDWPLRGLSLEEGVLRQIYEETPLKFLDRSRPPQAVTPLEPDSPYWKNPSQ